MQLGEGEVPITGKTAVIGPPPGAGGPPPRMSSPNIPVVTPAPNVQVRPSVFGMPAAADLQGPDGVHPSIAGQTAITRALVRRLADPQRDPASPR